MQFLQEERGSRIMDFFAGFIAGIIACFVGLVWLALYLDKNKKL
jgi:hypothetical protein